MAKSSTSQKPLLITWQVGYASVFQVVLLFLLWLILRVLLLFQRRQEFEKLDKKSKKKTSMRQTAGTDQYRINFSKYTPGKTTITALVNLQKTQCGFFFALDVAILAASRSRTALGAVNTADLKVNIEALRLLVAGATLLPVLTQYLLQHLHQSSGLFAASVITAFCSFIVQLATLKPNQWTYVPDSGGPWSDACGGQSPINFCDPATTSSAGFITRTFHIFAFLVLLVGLIIVIWCWIKEANNFFNATWPLFDVVFVVFLSIYASRLRTLLNRNTSIETSGWSFGQTIAVILWVPLILEWWWAMLSKNPAESQP